MCRHRVDYYLTGRTTGLTEIKMYVYTSYVYSVKQFFWENQLNLNDKLSIITDTVSSPVTFRL